LFRAFEVGNASAVTSEFTLAQALVKPLEIDRQDIADPYVDLIQSSDHLIVIPIDRSVLVDAAHYRARLGIKLPDAIHVATAAAASCEVFLSNDRRIKTPAGIALQRLG
jgi:predicted nucleic acid-binding protein